MDMGQDDASSEVEAFPDAEGEEETFEEDPETDPGSEEEQASPKEPDQKAEPELVTSSQSMHEDRQLTEEEKQVREMEQKQFEKKKTMLDDEEEDEVVVTKSFVKSPSKRKIEYLQIMKDLQRLQGARGIFGGS